MMFLQKYPYDCPEIEPHDDDSDIIERVVHAVRNVYGFSGRIRKLFCTYIFIYLL